MRATRSSVLPLSIGCWEDGGYPSEITFLRGRHTLLSGAEWGACSSTRIFCLESNQQVVACGRRGRSSGWRERDQWLDVIGKRGGLLSNSKAGTSGTLIWSIIIEARRQSLSELLNGRNGASPEMAIRLEKAGGAVPKSGAGGL
jgi:hypothetical protein